MNDFELIFSSNAEENERYDWSEKDYKRGWGVFGYSIPPPMELFNAMQYKNDVKMKFLYDGMTDIITTEEIDGFFEEE